MTQINKTTGKRTIPLYVELERVSHNRMRDAITAVLKEATSAFVTRPYMLLALLKFLDCANLLDQAMENEAWDDLPFDVELVLGADRVLPLGGC